MARPWCGRLGPTENCPLGVVLADVSSQGHAPLDRRLDLPTDWVHDPVRRAECHVPADGTDRKTGEMAHDLLRRSGPEAPHTGVVGDDEFGRASEFRAALRTDGERYVLDVPCHTNIRDRDGRRPPRQKAHKGPQRQVPFVRVDPWARKLPADRWTRLTIRAGAQGPRAVEAVSARVGARRTRRIGPEERLWVTRTLDPKPDGTDSLSQASPDESLVERVRARSRRHQVEEVLQEGQGEVGLGPDEVRSGVGWHHHVTRALLALWFLILERGRMGGKNPGSDRLADAGDRHRIAPQASPDGTRDRRSGQSRLAA